MNIEICEHGNKTQDVQQNTESLCVCVCEKDGKNRMNMVKLLFFSSLSLSPLLADVLLFCISCGFIALFHFRYLLLEENEREREREKSMYVSICLCMWIATHTSVHVMLHV